MSDNGNPNAPAGWYPDATNTAIQRFWDGHTWTEHTAPGAVQPPLLAGPHPAASGKAKLSAGKVALISGGGVLALILVVSIAVGSANRNPTQPDAALVATTAPTPIQTPTPTPTPTLTREPVKVEAPAVAAPPVVDPEYFRNSANRDMDKDLDDMVVALDEAGTLRILGNTVEIEFNLAQLQTLDVPASASAEWTAGVAGLESPIIAMNDASGNDDYTGIRVQVEAIRAQLIVLRDVVARTT